MPIAVLSIDINARLASLERDMGRAAHIAEASAKKMEAAFSAAGKALGVIGVGLSVGAIIGDFGRVVTALADLDDAAEIAGTSVENMSRLLGVAAENGKSIGEIASAAALLQKAMLGVDADTGKAALAFKALGLSLSGMGDGTDALIAFAKELDKYEDGAEKTRMAIAVLGKAGSQLLPLLKDIANANDLTARAYASQAGDAEKLQKAWNRLGFEVTEMKIALMGDLIPSLADTAKEFREARDAGFGFAEALGLVFGATKRQQIDKQAQAVNEYRDLVEKLNTSLGRFSLEQKDQAVAQLAREEQKLQKLVEQLNVEERRQTTEKQSAATLRDKLKAIEAQTDAQAAAAKAASDAAREAEQHAKSLAAAYNEVLGISSDYAEKVSLLQELERKKSISTEQYVAAIKKLGEAQPVMRAHIKALEDLEKASLDAFKAHTEATEAATDKEMDGAESARQAVLAMQDEIDAIGLTSAGLVDLANKQTDRAIATLQARAADLEATGAMQEQVAAIRTQIHWLEQLKAKRGEKQDREIGRDAAKSEEEAAQRAAQAATDAWQKFADDTEEAITDSLMRAFERSEGFGEAAITTLKNLFKTLVLRPTLQMGVQSVFGSGAGQGGAGGTLGAASGMSNTFQGLSNAYSMYTGGYQNLAGQFALSGAGQAMGLRTASGANATAGAMYTAEPILELSAAGNAFTGAAGTFATAVIGFGAVLAWYKMEANNPDTGRFEGAFMTDPSLLADLVASRVVADWAINPVMAPNIDGEMRPSYDHPDVTLQGITQDTAGNESARKIGETIAAAILRSARDFGGTGANQPVGLAFSQETDGGGVNRYVGQVGGFSTGAINTAGSGNEDMPALFAEMSSKMLLAGLQAADLPAVYADYFRKFDPATLNTEGITAAINAARATAELRGSLEGFGSVFDNVTGLSVELSNSLITLAGGLGNLQALTATFYNEFFTAEERLGNLKTQVVSAFTEMGVAFESVDTREEYRDLVMQAKNLGEADQERYLALLQLGGPLDAVFDAADAATEAVGKLNDSFYSQDELNARLVASFADLGVAFADIDTRAEFRAAVERSLADGNIELYNALVALQGPLTDFIDDAEEAAKALARRALTDDIESVTGEMDGLEAIWGDLSPVVRTLGDDLADAESAFDSLDEQLKALLGTVDTSAIGQLRTAMGTQDQYGSARGTLNDQIFEALLRTQTPAEQVTTLRGREGALWAGLDASADPAGTIAEIVSTTLARIRTEGQVEQGGADALAEATRDAYDDQIKMIDGQRQLWRDQIGVIETASAAYAEQLNALERQQDFSRSLFEFTSNLRLGDMSTLGRRDQLEFAQDRFRETLFAARGGDEYAREQLTGVAQDYLTEGKESLRNTGFSAVFSEVTSALDALGLSTSDTGAIEQMREQIRLAEDQVGLLAGLLETSTDDLEEIRRLRGGVGDLAVAVDTLPEELAGLMDVSAQIEPRENAIATSVDGLTAAVYAELDDKQTDRDAQRADREEDRTRWTALNTRLININGLLEAMDRRLSAAEGIRA